MDPYTPPSARIEDLSAPRRSQVPRIVAAAAAVQAVLVCINAKTYGEMIDTGEVSALTGLIALVSCILLYVGAVRFARHARHGRYPLLLSAAGLWWTWCHWSDSWIGPYPLLLGALVAAIGCLAAIRLGRSDAPDSKAGQAGK